MQLSVSGLQRLPHLFDLSDVPSSQYREVKEAGFQRFLRDYKENSQRYIQGSLPKLPFADRSFGLVLSANLLFLYGPLRTGGLLVKDRRFDYKFHLSAILELYRVCSQEVRIYPLKGANSPHNSPYLAAVLDDLKKLGIKAEVLPVLYRGIKGATDMLRLGR